MALELQKRTNVSLM